MRWASGRYFTLATRNRIACSSCFIESQTVQTVAFLSYLFHEMHQFGPFLVIVPLSTITAWQTQFAAWAPDMNVITYIGTAPAREVIRTYEFGPSNKKLKLNVLLTTYELTLRDSKELGEIKWQALAVDEVPTYGPQVSNMTDQPSFRRTVSKTPKASCMKLFDRSLLRRSYSLLALLCKTTCEVRVPSSLRELGP